MEIDNRSDTYVNGVMTTLTSLFELYAPTMAKKEIEATCKFIRPFIKQAYENGYNFGRSIGIQEEMFNQMMKNK